MIAKAPPRWLSLTGRTFGFIALVIGLALIVTILWTMLFQYK
jgi:hypothetical protein